MNGRRARGALNVVSDLLGEGGPSGRNIKGFLAGTPTDSVEGYQRARQEVLRQATQGKLVYFFYFLL